MSNSVQPQESDISIMQSSMIGAYMLMACSSLCCYEWAVTFGQEVDHIWSQKWTLSTWIFAVSRYATLVYSILQMLPIASHTVWSYHVRRYYVPTNQLFYSCVVMIRLGGVFILLQYLALALFTGLRTAALCNRNIWLFIVVFGLGVVPDISNLLEYINGIVLYLTMKDIPIQVCEEKVLLSPAVTFGLSVSVRLAVIAADVIALAVSWNKAVGTVREAARFNIEVSISGVLIRDGTVLFIGLLALNIFEIVSNTIPKGMIIEPANSLIAPLSSILMCRFILNLKQAASPKDSTAHMSAMVFNSDVLIGNLGGSLHLGPEGDATSTAALAATAENNVIEIVQCTAGSSAHIQVAS